MIASFLVPSHENGTVVPRWDRDVEQLSSTALAREPKTIDTIPLHWVDRFAGTRSRSGSFTRSITLRSGRRSMSRIFHKNWLPSGRSNLLTAECFFRNQNLLPNRLTEHGVVTPPPSILQCEFGRMCSGIDSPPNQLENHHPCGAVVGTDITTKNQDLLYQQCSGSKACSSVWSRRIRLSRENAEWSRCDFRINNR